MSRSLKIAAIVLAMTFANGFFHDESLTATGMTPAAQAGVTGSPRDVEAIQQIVTTFDRTWGSDPVTYAAQYGSVIDWVGPTGTILNDPDAITALYTFLFTNVFAGTTRISTIRNLTFLSGTIAVLDIETQVVGFGRALEKNVLIKRAGEWRILLHQQTLVTP
jgi:hypothetical protein